MAAAGTNAQLVPRFEKADALLEICLVGILVLTDQLQALLLLGAPLRSRAVKEVGVDPTIELVDLHRVDAVL